MEVALRELCGCSCAELFRKLKGVEQRCRAEGRVMPETVTSGLIAYLHTLPGMKPALVNQIFSTGVLPGKLAVSTYDNHGYVTMQLMPVVSMLSDECGHALNGEQCDDTPKIYPGERLPEIFCIWCFGRLNISKCPLS